MPIKSSSSLDSREILTAEFEYIASTATQANEDRARVASFYLVAVGSLLAAIFSTQLLDSKMNVRTTGLLFGSLFLVLTILGTLTVMQLARLRAAWYESMLAMNQIKEYVIGKEKDYAKAFRWRSKTLPPLHKPHSVSYYQTLEVTLISGLTSGASAFFYQEPFFVVSQVTWVVTILTGIVVIILQLLIYQQSLK